MTFTTDSLLGFFKDLLLILSVFSLLIVYLNFKVDMPKNTNVDELKPASYLQEHRVIGAEENVTVNEIPKVLILTQARSGSSFVGSLMSAGAGAYYLFEPYHSLKFKNHRLDDMLDAEEPGAIELAKNIFFDIYDCKTFNSSMDSLSISRSKMKKCETATSIVIKSIRLRYSSIQAWINDTDVKVMRTILLKYINRVLPRSFIWSAIQEQF